MTNSIPSVEVLAVGLLECSEALVGVDPREFDVDEGAAGCGPGALVFGEWAPIAGHDSFGGCHRCRAEGQDHLAHGFEPLSGVDGGCPLDHQVDGGWDLRADGTNARDRCASLGFEHRLNRLGGEGRASRQQLVGGDTEAVDIGPVGDVAASHLLGAGVQRRARRTEFVLVFTPVGPHRNAEVGEERHAVLVEQDVRRLYVAMDHTSGVRNRQRTTDLLDDRDDTRQCQWPLGNQLVLGGTSSEQPHHQVGTTGFAPVVVQRNDVRMLEAGDQLCLGLEAADEVGVVGELGTDHLDRHFASNGRLGGAMDRAEGAFADLLAQLIAADRRTRLRTTRHQPDVVIEDPAFEVAQLEGRFHSEFAKMESNLLEMAEGLDLSAAAIQGSMCR